MLVFYKYLLLYFCFLMNFLVSFRICSTRIGICSTLNMLHFQHSHIKLSSEFLLIKPIKIDYICSILYFRQIISCINTIKFRFVLIILFVFQSFLKDETALKILTCSNGIFTSSKCTFTCSNCTSSYLDAIAPLPVNRFLIN